MKDANRRAMFANIGKRKDLTVSWKRKAVDFSDIYFDENDEEEFKPTAVKEVSPEIYDRVANSLEDFPFVKPKGSFVLTDKERFLAVDPQGYDYPRYKSAIKLDTHNKLLPYEKKDIRNKLKDMNYDSWK